jgi:hypothetical protein
MFRNFLKRGSNSSSSRSTPSATADTSQTGATSYKDQVESAGYKLSSNASLTLMKVPLSRQTYFANYLNSLKESNPGELGSGTATVPSAPGFTLSKREFWRYKRRIDLADKRNGSESELGRAANIVWKHIFNTEPISSEHPYPGLTEPDKKSSMNEGEMPAWDVLHTELMEFGAETDPGKYAIDGLHAINEGDVGFAWEMVDVISKYKPEASTARG